MPSAATASLYAESSGVLAWLLGEPRGGDVRRLLAGARQVLTSELTLIECDRVLIRAETIGEMSAAKRSELRATVQAAMASWGILRLDEEVVMRARQPFPREPMHTLDAIHLATALVARSAVRDLSVVSLDDRLRRSARLLGLTVVPE
jgi:predicted nucleic acid-binding protein